MSSHTNSFLSKTSTSISLSENMPNNYINTNLVNNICILFEALINSNKLKLSSKKINLHNSSFELKRIPIISLYDYLCRIVNYILIDDDTLIYALIYIDRIYKNKFILTPFNIHKLLFTSIVLAAKYKEDICLSKKKYSEIGGITIKEFEKMEIEFCLFINYRLYIKQSLFEKYFIYITNDYLFNNS